MITSPALPHPSPVPLPVCFFCSNTQNQAPALIGYCSKWICSDCLGKCGRSLWPDEGEVVPAEFEVRFRERAAT
jgi:hypothetical protein